MNNKFVEFIVVEGVLNAKIHCQTVATYVSYIWCLLHFYMVLEWCGFLISVGTDSYNNLHIVYTVLWVGTDVDHCPYWSFMLHQMPSNYLCPVAHRVEWRLEIQAVCTTAAAAAIFGFCFYWLIFPRSLQLSQVPRRSPRRRIFGIAGVRF